MHDCRRTILRRTRIGPSSRHRLSAKIARLGEERHYCKKRDADDGRDHTKDCLLQGLPGVGSATIASVISALDRASSRSQKLTYNATIAASQIRRAKAQEVRGKPQRKEYFTFLGSVK